MRSNKKLQLLLCFTLSLYLPSFAQSFWNNTFFTAGIALSDQDRRLYDFPGAVGILEREKTKFDYEYNLFLQKSIVKSNLFQVNMGLGYSEYNSTFSRPFKHSALNGGDTKELRYVKRYTINKWIFPVSNRLFLMRNQSIFFNFNIVPVIAFRKSAKDLSFKKRETKWELELNSLELYPGVGIKLNPRMQLAAHYRWVYIYKLDEVIFNHLLTNERDPAFLRKKYDDYNPFKVWITVSYALGQ